MANDSRCGLNFKTAELVKNPVATLIDTLHPTSSSCGPMSYVSLSFPLWGAVTQSILRPDSKAQVLANDPVPLEDLATGAHRNSFGV